MHILEMQSTRVSGSLGEGRAFHLSQISPDTPVCPRLFIFLSFNGSLHSLREPGVHTAAAGSQWWVRKCCCAAGVYTGPAGVLSVELCERVSLCLDSGSAVDYCDLDSLDMRFKL